MKKVNIAKSEALRFPDKYIWIVGKGAFLKFQKEKAPHPQEIDAENVISFSSNAKDGWNALSNFAWVQEGFVFEGLKYPSSEHAFQARRFIESDRARFSSGGDLGNLSGFQLVYGDEWESKQAFWMKKGNIGILAKMASNPAVSKKIGLTPITGSFNSTDELWIGILSQKFSVPKFREVLKKTDQKYLLEFDRSAAKNKDSPPYWGGAIIDGKLVGHNKMGNYLMKVRETI